MQVSTKTLSNYLFSLQIVGTEGAILSPRPSLCIVEKPLPLRYRAACMPVFRALIRNHRQLAFALLVLALCIKAAVPAGFMIAPSADRFITVTICSDSSSGLQQMQMLLVDKEQGSSHSDAAPKAEACAFSSLAQMSTGGVDAMVLATALAFILTLGFAPSLRLPSGQFAHVRPPLRGPPATA